MLILLSFLFVITTLSATTFIAYNVMMIRGALLENTNLPFAERLAVANQKALLVDILSSWSSLYGLPTVIADTIVVWRVYALSPNTNKIAKIFLSVLLAISFSFCITNGVLATIVQLKTDNTEMSRLTNDILNVMLSSSLLTNIVATTMIGVKAYEQRKMMKEIIGMRPNKTSVVLYFMTESGAIYCILQAVYVGLQMSNSPPLDAVNFATDLYENIFWTISVVYPSLVFLIIRYNYSIDDFNNNSTLVWHDIERQISFTFHAANVMETGSGPLCPQHDRGSQSRDEIRRLDTSVSSTQDVTLATAEKHDASA